MTKEDIETIDMFDHIQSEVHSIAKSKGWHRDSIRNMHGELDINRVLAHLALHHSEISEATECARVGQWGQTYENGKPEGFASELADVVIRIMDTLEAMDMSLGEALVIKVAYNKTRPDRHGGKLA